MSWERPRALWRLARPRGLVLAAMAPLTGYALAHWSRALPLRAGSEILLVILGWLWLNAGTLWWNASLDRDEGPVLYGEPARVPPGVQREGSLGLLIAVGLAALAGRLPALAALFSALLAIGYSHPAVAWKTRPLAGPAVNVLGCGVASPLAGYAVVGVPLDLRSAMLIGALALSVLGAFFLAQSFQQDEDGSRGYRTLVATGGPGAALSAARYAFRASHLTVLGLAVAGWIPAQCLGALPVCLLLDRVLARQAASPEGVDESRARELILMALLVGLLFVIGASVAWIGQVIHGLPLAGLGTSAGVPADAAGENGWHW